MLHECSTGTLYYKTSFRLKAAVLGEGVPDTLAARVHVVIIISTFSTSVFLIFIAF